jgi:putative hemolysin
METSATEHEVKLLHPRLRLFRERFAAVPLGQRIRNWVWNFLFPPQALHKVQSFIESSSLLAPAAFVDASLSHLQARYQLDPIALERIPEQGALIVVSNHPLGAVDALCLISALSRRRHDIRLFANDMLQAIAPLSPLLIPIDIFSKRSNVQANRAAQAHLEAGGCLVIFPAGEVSRLGPQGIADRQWQPGFARLALRTGASVLPMYVQARNSLLFYLAALMHKELATLMLVREALKPYPSRTVRLETGSLIESIAPQSSMQELYEQKDLLQGLLVQARSAVYDLQHRLQSPRLAKRASIAAEGNTRQWWSELQRAEVLAVTSDHRELRLARVQRGSALLQELGRVREQAFRHVGEGGSQARDIDDFDLLYEHLILVDPRSLEIVGAYRLGLGSELLAQGGERGFYSATLFSYMDAFREKLPDSLELGRSFLNPKWFRTRALDELWIGIGLYLARHTHVRWLFGLVSASAALPVPARNAIVRYYSVHFGSAVTMARAHQPWTCSEPVADFAALEKDQAFALLRAELKRQGVSLPPLFKLYSDLTFDSGVSFLAFGVDPKFCHCVDGLVLVDTRKVKPEKAKRWLPTVLTDSDTSNRHGEVSDAKAAQRIH